MNKGLLILVRPDLEKRLVPKRTVSRAKITGLVFGSRRDASFVIKGWEKEDMGRGR